MIDGLIRAQARLQPTSHAIVMPTCQITYAQFDAAIDRACHALDGLCATRPDCVSVAVQSDYYLHWIVVMALSRSGIATTPPGDLEAPATVSDTELARANVFNISSSMKELIFGGRLAPFTEPSRVPEALGRVLCSSGTTGAVKRIGLSWRIIEARVRNAVRDYGPIAGPCVADSGIDTALGLITSLAAWASGSAVVWNHDLDPERLALMRPHLITLVPYRLGQLLCAIPEGYPSWRLRLICGGGAIPAQFIDRVRRQPGWVLNNLYGSSEAGTIALAGMEDLECDPAVAGAILPNVEVQIIDENGAPVAKGSVGELKVRGEKVISNDLIPRTIASPSKGGWLHTGDICRFNEQGFLVLEGRVDDVINIAGQKLLPAWIEAAAISCPEVSEAAAFAMPDGNGLESCWMALVTSEEIRPDVFRNSLQEVLKWIPKIHLFRVHSLPRNAMGKVERLRLPEILYEATKGSQSGTSILSNSVV